MIKTVSVKTTFYIVLSSIFLWMVGVHMVSAGVVSRSGDMVSVAEGQVIEGGFYAVGGTVSLSGIVDDDVAVLGGDVTLNGEVTGDAILLGLQTEVHGPVGGDLRVVSGEVTIADPVNGDLFVVGTKVHILSSASVSGDILMYGGQVTVEGSVGGDIVGSVASLRVDGSVAGDIDVSVDQLTLGARAAVDGSVRYVSYDLLVRSPESTVSGELTRSDPVMPSTDTAFRSVVVSVLMAAFAVLLWFLLSRKSLTLVVQNAVVKSPRPFLLGLIAFILLPLVGVTFLVSVVGLYVGLITLLGYLLLLIISFIGAIAVLGRLLYLTFSQPSAQVSLLSIAVGLVALIALVMLPLVGGIILFTCMILTLGAVINVLLVANRQ